MERWLSKEACFGTNPDGLTVSSHSSPSRLHCTGVTGTHSAIPGFLCGCWHLNWGPHASAVWTLRHWISHLSIPLHLPLRKTIFDIQCSTELNRERNHSKRSKKELIPLSYFSLLWQDTFYLWIWVMSTVYLTYILLFWTLNTTMELQIDAVITLYRERRIQVIGGHSLTKNQRARSRASSRRIWWSFCVLLLSLSLSLCDGVKAQIICWFLGSSELVKVTNDTKL